MSKMKKIGIGVAVVLGLALIGSFMPDSEETPAPVEKEVAAQVEKEPSLTKDELIEKLETYETMYNNHIAGIDKVAQENDTAQMQKTLEQSRDIASGAFSALSELKGEYNSDSNEYKALNEMQTVYSSLEDACKDGIEYINKNETKYLDKYEENIKQTQIFIERYNEIKSNI